MLDMSLTPNRKYPRVRYLIIWVTDVAYIETETFYTSGFASHAIRHASQGHESVLMINQVAMLSPPPSIALNLDIDLTVHDIVSVI